MKRITAWCMRRPTWVVIAFVTACLITGHHAAQLPQRIGVESALGPEHALILEFHDFIEHFGGGQPILLAWECGPAARCGTVLEPHSLEAAHRLTEFLEPSPGIVRVTSPTNAPLLVPEGESGFSQRRLIEQGEAAADLAELTARAARDPAWVGRWVSSDARVGVMVIETASSRTEDLVNAVEVVSQASEKLRRHGFLVHTVGQPILEEALATGALRDGAVLSGGVALILAAVIFGLFRTWIAVAVVLCAIGGGALASMGWMVAAGYPRDPISAAAPMLVMVIGSAVGLHLFSLYLHHRAHRHSRIDAMVKATSRLFVPCGLATLTTAGALLSYALGDLDALTRLGFVAAFGIAAAFCLCFTLLPALVALLPAEHAGARRSVDQWEPHLQGLARFATARSVPILCGSGMVLAASLWGATQLGAKTDSISYLHHAHPASVANRFLSHHVRPTQSLEVEVSLPAGQTWMDPGALSQLAKLEQALAEEPWLSRPASILEPVRQLNRLIHDDQPAAYEVPTAANAAAEIMMLLSMGDPGALDSLVTLDQRRARLSAPVKRGGDRSTSRDFTILERKLRNLMPTTWELRFTGPLVLQRWQLDLTVSSMARSLSLAVFLVFAVLVAYLRSLRWALLAMVPNLFPLVILAGAMGAFAIPFDAASASVGTMAIGIAVDDTIHMLVALRRNRGRGGPEACIDAAICEVGRPIIITSLAFGFGFLALLPSSFPGVANMGLLSSLAVFAALVADLFLLPALIHQMPGLVNEEPHDYLASFDVPLQH